VGWRMVVDQSSIHTSMSPPQIVLDHDSEDEEDVEDDGDVMMMMGRGTTTNQQRTPPSSSSPRRGREAHHLKDGFGDGSSSPGFFPRPAALTPPAKDGKTMATGGDITLDLRRYYDSSAIKVSETFSLERAYLLFRTLGLRHLVVVDHHNRVVGIVTRRDLQQENIRDAMTGAIHSNHPVL